MSGDNFRSTTQLESMGTVQRPGFRNRKEEREEEEQETGQRGWRGKSWRWMMNGGGKKVIAGTS